MGLSEQGLAGEHETYRGRVEFDGARFATPVRFVQCRFAGPLSLRGALFEQGVTFLDCDFDDDVDFSRSMFLGRCYFWRSQFRGPARFDNCVVRPTELGGPSWPAGPATRAGDADPGGGRVDRHAPPVLPGETNFSWTDFAADANFYRMQCGGPVWFWRPVFRGDTVFSESTMAGPFRLYGAAHEVCLTPRDLTDPGLFDRLLALELVDPDPETTLAPFGVLRRYRSRLELESALAGHGLAAAEVAEVAALWARRALPALPADRPTGFRFVAFEQPAKAEFCRVDLSRCSLRDTVVEEVGFLDVGWARRRVWPAGSRVAAYDEMVAGDEDYGAVQRLYGQLEASYYRRGGYREASEFRYGKMEMLLRAQRAPLRWVSVLAGYRHLSGYGERYGLALTLLALFVLVVFPLLYLVLGAAGNLPRAVLHSLEISTFQNPSAPPSPGVAAHVAEAVHRVVVPLQAGLSALAVNRRLGRA